MDELEYKKYLQENHIVSVEELCNAEITPEHQAQIDSIVETTSLNEGEGLFKAGLAILKAIPILGQYIKSKYQVKYTWTLHVTKKQLDMYKETDKLLRSNEYARHLAKNNIVKCTFPYPHLINKKNKKAYRAAYCSLFLPIDDVTRWITEAMEMSDIKDRLYNLNGVKDAINNWLNKNYWYMYDTQAVIHVTGGKAKLEDALMYTKRYIDDTYAWTATLNDLISNETIYVAAFQKAYVEDSRRYSSDKKCMAVIDDIYKICINATKTATDWNLALADQYGKCLEDNFKQISGYYDIIKNTLTK